MLNYRVPHQPRLGVCAPAAVRLHKVQVQNALHDLFPAGNLLGRTSVFQAAMRHGERQQQLAHAKKRVMLFFQVHLKTVKTSQPAHQGGRAPLLAQVLEGFNDCENRTAAIQRGSAQKGKLQLRVSQVLRIGSNGGNERNRAILHRGHDRDLTQGRQPQIVWKLTHDFLLKPWNFYASAFGRRCTAELSVNLICRRRRLLLALQPCNAERHYQRT